MPSQVVLKDQAQHVRARTGESRLINREYAFNAAPEHDWAVAGQHAVHRLRLHADQGFDLTSAFGIVARQEESEQITQALAAFAVIHVAERKVIKVQLPDQTPRHFPLRV